MPVSNADDITIAYLREKSLTDLLETHDRVGEGYLDAFLAAALHVANEFLSDHGKQLDRVPEIEYDPWQSGVVYDPYHGSDEALIVGGPRGILQGGYQTLRDHGHIERTSLLNILTKGLLHSYHQQLVDQYFDRHGMSTSSAKTAGIELYDEYMMLNPAVDEGFAQMFALYVDGDITDGGLREAYIEAWAAWYQELAQLPSNLFRAVAYTVSDRAEDAEGIAEETIIHALRIQDPLIRNADVGVISARLD